MVALLLLSSVAAQATDDNNQRLRELMAAMRASRGVYAEFVEQKRIALLTEPLESRGRLYFAPPEALLRLTVEPSDTRLLISGDDVRYRDAAGADRFDLSSNSAARQFVENFLVLFTGDLEQLRDRYEVAFEIEDETWRLDLRPRRAPFDRLVEQVVLRGKGRLLGSIEMIEKDGDSTVTRIVDMDPDRSLTSEHLSRMFSD